VDRSIREHAAWSQAHACLWHARGWPGLGQFRHRPKCQPCECRRTASLCAVRLGCTLLDLEGTKAGHAQVQSTIGTHEK
jgi:hypothetical protein